MTNESNAKYGQPSFNGNIADQPRMPQLGFRTVDTPRRVSAFASQADAGGVLTVALLFGILSSAEGLRPLARVGLNDYQAGTVMMVAAMLLLIRLWRVARAPLDPGGKPSRAATVLFSAIAAPVVVLGTARLLGHVLEVPFERNGADMLTVIAAALEQLARGENPYVPYAVAHEATLAYGPPLWLPYALPYLARVDIRTVSLFGQLLVPTMCAIVGVICARNRRWLLGAALIILASSIFANHALLHFAPMAHTPSYWPLILVFGLIYDRTRTGAAIVLGLIVAARSTWVAVLPIFVIDQWYRDRARWWRPVLLCGATTAAAYLPFAIWSPTTLWYAIYTYRDTIVKTLLWDNRYDAMINTFGLSGYLFARGWQRYIEAAQVAVMLAVFAAAARALKHGARPLPWMAVALTVFSMTCIWPVYYLYFDSFLLFATAALVEWTPLRTWSWRREVAMLAGVALSIGVVSVGLAAARAMVDTRLDIGTLSGRYALTLGFGPDEAWEGRSFAWMRKGYARVEFMRTSWRPGTLRIECFPYALSGQGRQRVTFALNGVPLGTFPLEDGWHTVEVRPPAEVWIMGWNRLEIHAAYAVSPREAGVGNDNERRAVAIDFIEVTQ